MANIFIESFDWCPAGNLDSALGVAGYFTDQPNSNKIITRERVTGVFVNNNPGYAYGLIGDGNYCIWEHAYRNDATSREIFFGMRVFIGNSQDYSKIIGMDLFNAQNNLAQIGVRFDDYGIIRVYRGPPGTGTLLASSLPEAYYKNASFFFEMHAYIDNTSGYVECRVNTETVVDVVAVDTQNGAPNSTDSFRFGSYGGGATSNPHYYVVDDIYVNDPTGSKNNDYLGNVRSVGQFMIANGDHIAFAIGGSAPAATNWQSVQNTAFNDTKFVYSGTPGDYDLYQPNPIINSPLVHAIQVRASMKMTDATQRSVKYKMKVNGTEYTGGVEFFINQNYSIYADVWEVNPDTGVDFTGTEANGVQVGQIEYS